MNKRLKKSSPFILFFLGLFLLFYMGQTMPAGVCLLLGIVFALERIWPEEWEAEKKKKKSQA